LINLPPKKKIVPNKRMPAYNWVKIPPNKVKETFWEVANDEKYDINAPRLEELFGMDTLEKTIKPKGETKPKKVIISLIPSKRSNNIEIMLKGFKGFKFSKISKAISDVNTEMFDDDQIQTLTMYWPEEEEIKSLKAFTGNYEELGNAEKYLLAIMEIPQLQFKLTCMKYKKDFPDNISLIKTKYKLLRNGLKIIRKDSRFTEVLEIVLAIGNYINGNTPRGGFYGFKLSSLEKLVEVKSRQNNEITLLHFFSEYLQQHQQSVLEFFDDMDDVHLCARDSLDELSGSINLLITGFKPIEAALSSENCEDKIKSRLSGWADDAKITLETLRKNVEKLHSEYKVVLNYYAEPPGTKSEEFFTNLSNFGKGVKKSIDDLKRIIEEEERRKRMEEKKEQRPKVKKLGSFAPPNEGQLDLIISQMKKVLKDEK